MKRHPYAFIVGCVCVAIASSANAHAQTNIPIRMLSAPDAVSPSNVGGLGGVRELSDGRVLVNESGNRRAVLFDKALANFQIVADSSIATHNLYGKRPTGIIPYVGDTTLLIDVGARAFLVMSPSGAVTRVMSAPRQNDVAMMGSSEYGAPGFDSKGRLIYRSFALPPFKAPVAGKPYDAPVMPDSTPILRGDFNTRSADTLAWVRVAKMRITVTPIAGGGVTMSPVVNPLANIDDWALLPDGTIAVLRGQDYHIDWVSTDGTRSSSPKMPFDWKRLTDEEKNAIVDSTKKALAKIGETSIAAAVATGHGAPSGGGHGMTIMPLASNDGGPAPQAAMGATSGAPLVPEVGPVSDLPDYMPPVLRAGLMKSDMQGNLWILPSTSSQSGNGLLYDVV
ncbi:MAG: hypothetical protein ABJB66_21885, partial [Gemmatimonadaceae bacterium]